MYVSVCIYRWSQYIADLHICMYVCLSYVRIGMSPEITIHSRPANIYMCVCIYGVSLLITIYRPIYTHVCLSYLRLGVSSVITINRSTCKYICMCVCVCPMCVSIPVRPVNGNLSARVLYICVRLDMSYLLKLISIWLLCKCFGLCTFYRHKKIYSFY